MDLPIFSKRHHKRIKSKKIKIKLTTPIKRRILFAMEDYNLESYGWSNDTLDTVDQLLRKEHGWLNLECRQSSKGKMKSVGIRDFILGDQAHHIFDAIELFSKELSDSRYSFQKEINKIFTESHLPWRLSDNVIFQVDSEYMNEVLECASRLISTQGFNGAHQEFQGARVHFDNGDYKAAARHANLALESTMKSILRIQEAKPGELIRRMVDSEFIPSYYKKFAENFEQMLMTVSFARNKEKGVGHGQGRDIVDISSNLSQLILNFCGALIVFLTNEYIETIPAPPEPPIESTFQDDGDDIPF